MKIAQAIGIFILPATFALLGCDFGSEKSSNPGDSISDDPLGGMAALTSDPKLVGVAGCWTITDQGLKGSVTLRQEGTDLTGYVAWEGKPDGVVMGKAHAKRIDLNFEYGGGGNGVGLPKSYNLAVAANGRSMSRIGGSQPAISVQWARCGAGCWQVTQPSFAGILTLTDNGLELNGFMDWEGQADATVTGKKTGNQADLVFTYMGNRRGQVAIYRGIVSEDGMRTLTGVFHSATDTVVKTPFQGSNVPCKSVAGCFEILQTDQNGKRSGGRWTITRARPTLVGKSEWLDHPSGLINGARFNRKMTLEFTYPGTPKQGFINTYDVTIDAGGDYLIGSSHCEHRRKGDLHGPAGPLSARQVGGAHRVGALSVLARRLPGWRC